MAGRHSRGSVLLLLLSTYQAATMQIIHPTIRKTTVVQPALRTATVVQPALRTATVNVPRHSSCVAAADYVSTASSLFANVRLPASILAGALVPLGFGFVLPVDGPAFEPATRRWLIRLHRLVAIVSYACLLTCIVYSSVSINSLVEVGHAPSTSVIELIRREYELQWLATNVTFQLGLCGTLLLVAIRALLTWELAEGQVAAGFCGAALLLMASVVDDQVKLGGYSDDLLHLVGRSGGMIVDYATSSRSPLLCAALVLGAASTAAGGLTLVGVEVPGVTTPTRGATVAAAAATLTTSPVNSVESTVAQTGEGALDSSGDASAAASGSADDGADVGAMDVAGDAGGAAKIIGDVASFGDAMGDASMGDASGSADAAVPPS